MRPAGIKIVVLCLFCALLAGCASGYAVMGKPVHSPEPQHANTAEVLITPPPVSVVPSNSPNLSGSPEAALPGLTPIQTAMPVAEEGVIPVAMHPDSFERLAPTTNMSFEELVGDNGIYEEPSLYPTPDTFKVIIDIRHQVVLVYKRGAKGEYDVPVRYMICSTGAQKTPTPRGTFSAGDHRVRFGLFVNNGVYGQYWTQITRRIYFHSLLYTSRSASSYTRTSYNSLGKRVSHGCVRLLVPDARWMYYHIAPGTSIEIRAGEKEDAATAAIREQLIRPELPKERPDLQPGKVPNTDNWSIDTYLKGYRTTASAE